MNNYVAIRRIKSRDEYLCADLEWRRRRAGLDNIIAGKTPAELASILSALHFKRKVLDPGSDPLVDDNVFIQGPSGGLYRPLTGTPVRWEKV